MEKKIPADGESPVPYSVPGLTEQAPEAANENPAGETQQKDSNKWVFFTLALFFGIGLILIAVAVLLGNQSAHMMAVEKPAAGRVVDMAVHHTSALKKGGSKTYYNPVVEFTPPGGSLQRVEIDEQDSSQAAYDTGSTVNILYDPANPQNARIQSFSGFMRLWLPAVITAVIGIGFAAISGYIFWMLRSHRLVEVNPSTT